VEQETKKWEALLFDQQALHETKLKKLAAWNGNNIFQEVHYTLLLDKSWSMGGEPWRQLIVAMESFLKQCRNNPSTAAATTVTIVLFNHGAHIVRPTHAKVSAVQSIAHHPMGGGTNFGAAFSACHQVMNQSPAFAKELVLFLTDGAGDVPHSEISSLLADHRNRIKGLTCIAFGGQASQQGLEQIGSHFQRQNIAFELTTPTDEHTLVETFVEAAKSRAIHV